MSENLNETISMDEAVDLMVKEPETANQDADDVTDESQVDEVETEEVETEELETQEGEPDDDEDTDTETDEAEDEDTEEAEEGDDDPTFEIETVNGKIEVPLSELSAGYMRQADYTKKTMEASEVRKEAEAAKAELSQSKQQLEEALSYWAVPTEQEPNWAQVAQDRTPQEVFALQQQWGQRQQRKAQAAEYHQQLQAQAQAETLASEQAKLLEVFPDWRDPAKFREGAGAMVSAGDNYGFSAEEMAGMVDHRMFKVLNDAMKYRKLQADKPKVTKKVSKAPQKLKAGSKPQKGDASKVARQKQMDRLKKSGSVDDAVNLLLGG